MSLTVLGEPLTGLDQIRPVREVADRREQAHSAQHDPRRCQPFVYPPEVGHSDTPEGLHSDNQPEEADRKSERRD